MLLAALRPAAARPDGPGLWRPTPPTPVGSTSAAFKLVLQILLVERVSQRGAIVLQAVIPFGFNIVGLVLFPELKYVPCHPPAEPASRHPPLPL